MEKRDHVPRVADLDPDQWYPAKVVCLMIHSCRGIGISLATLHRLRMTGKLKVINRAIPGERCAWFVQGRELQRYLGYQCEPPEPEKLPERRRERNARINSALKSLEKHLGKVTIKGVNDGQANES